MRRICLFGLVLASSILAGCATSRSVVAVATPAAAIPKVPPLERSVVIRTIKDDRVFEQAPTEPNTPSLSSGAASAASDPVKARAIARKPDAYGQARGDILLKQGQTVSGLVLSNLTTAFEQAGYRVLPAGNAVPRGTTLVDVSIKKFWAWVRPGFWNPVFNAEIETVLTSATSAAPTIVSASASEPGPRATDDAWIDIMKKAMAAHQAQAASKLTEPFPF